MGRSGRKEPLVGWINTNLHKPTKTPENPFPPDGCLDCRKFSFLKRCSDADAAPQDRLNFLSQEISYGRGDSVADVNKADSTAHAGAFTTSYPSRRFFGASREICCVRKSQPGFNSLLRPMKSRFEQVALAVSLVLTTILAVEML